MNDSTMTAAVPARRGDWMQLYSGRRFWPLDPKPDEIFIEDIAHALARLCRYNGHCLRFYSVAEHSVHVARHVARRHALWALLHDASEAYLADVPRPLKAHLPGYKDMEARVMAAVCARFGLDAAMPKEVHEADDRIIGDERGNLSVCEARWSVNPEPLGIALSFWTPARAEAEFLTLFHELAAERVVQL